MKTTLYTLVFALLIGWSTTAQENITINIAQDARLAFLGDGHGNNAFTPNFTIRMEFQGYSNNAKTGYIFFAPEFEYADLARAYKRYSFNIGATLTAIERIPLSASVGYGISEHYGGYLAFSGNIQAGYRFSRTTIFGDMQIADRRELGLIRISGFVGIKFNITNN